MRRANRSALVIEMDAEELAYRIALTCLGGRAASFADDLTATEALDKLALISAATNECVRGWRAAAVVAMQYMAECTGRAVQMQ